MKQIVNGIQMNAVTIDSSSIVTVVQPTGSNLHCVLDTSNVVVQGNVNSLNTFAPGTMDVFGGLVVGHRNNQVAVSFVSGPVENLVTVTTTGTATALILGGQALFSTGTGSTADAKGVSFGETFYKPGHEIYSVFTAYFTQPTDTSSFQRIGHYTDGLNGFFLGYEGLTFGVVKLSGGIVTFTSQANFSGDLLDGSSGSKFTRNSVPEVLDKTKLNVFRIRFGWLGSAPVYFEILNPDGSWVTFHKILQPNLLNAPSIQDPNNPITVHVSKFGSDVTNLVVSTSCWAAGVVSDLNVCETSITQQINALGQEIVFDVQSGVSSASAQIFGTWVGIITFEGSVDGNNFVPQSVGSEGIGGLTVTQTSANGIYTTPVGSFQKFRLKAGNWSSGTAQITIRGSTATHGVMVVEPLPQGNNHLGEVTIIPGGNLGFFNSFTGNGQVFGPIPAFAGYSTASIQVSNTWIGTILVEASIDNINFATVVLYKDSDITSVISTNGIYNFPNNAYTLIKISTTSWVSGQADITINNSATVGSVIINSSLPSGTNVIGHVIQDNSAVVLAIAGSLAPTLVDGANVPLSVDTSGSVRMINNDALTPYHLISAAGTNPTVIKASAGRIYGWDIYNSNAALRKLAFHDTSSAPTAGSNVYFTFPLAPTSGRNQLAEAGINFKHGISFTTVTGISDVDSSSVVAKDLSINIFYK